jgi:hypothetical protein
VAALDASDRGWWMPHVMIAVFGLLVAAILGGVPGWSAPLHAWTTLAALVLVALAVHATVRASLWAWRRLWRAAALAMLLAVALGGVAAAMLGIGALMVLAVPVAIIFAVACGAGSDDAGGP